MLFIDVIVVCADVFCVCMSISLLFCMFGLWMSTHSSIAKETYKFALLHVLFLVQKYTM